LTGPRNPPPLLKPAHKITRANDVMGLSPPLRSLSS
jgi:hypothetical protein